MTRYSKGALVKSFTVAWLTAALAACGTTLPDDDSVFIRLGSNNLSGGIPIEAVVVNASDHAIGLGILPCTARIVRESTGEVVKPVEECIQPLTLLRSGGTYPFVIAAPDSPGDYRIEVDASDEDRDPPVAGLDLIIRSAPFRVTAP